MVKALLKSVIWNIPNNENKIYLTFDDGPTEGVTEKTLAVLNKHNVKATFFCLGQQIEKHSTIFNQIINKGHTIGNHSYSHLKGWTTNDKKYVNDVRKGKELSNSILFRPPYGKIKRSQLKIVETEMRTILWDVLPGDFSPKNTVDTIVLNTVKNVESGSIIVFHDNDKCGEKMLKALPLIIDKLQKKGFQFSLIE